MLYLLTLHLHGATDTLVNLKDIELEIEIEWDKEGRQYFKVQSRSFKHTTATGETREDAVFNWMKEYIQFA